MQEFHICAILIAGVAASPTSARVGVLHIPFMFQKWICPIIVLAPNLTKG
jgi:hypothetical protein